MILIEKLVNFSMIPCEIAEIAWIISNGSVNSRSQKIYVRKKFLAFHGIMFHFKSKTWNLVLAISREIILHHFSISSLKITKNKENCRHSQISRFPKMVKRKITVTLNSRKFWSRPITSKYFLWKKLYGSETHFGFSQFGLKYAIFLSYS